MKSKKVLVHASQALFAMTVFTCLVVGCDKGVDKTPLPEVYPAEGHAYMKDPEFKKQFEAQKREKNAILGEREKLFEAFAALEKREGSRAAAEKSPQWRVLEKKAEACMMRFETNRLRTAELFDARMKRALADSERIKRGEAKAKNISEKKE